MSIMAWRYWRWNYLPGITMPTRDAQFPGPTKNVHELCLHGARGGVWVPGYTMRAMCFEWGTHHDDPDDDAPVVGCGCGIYALKEPETLMSFQRCSSCPIHENLLCCPIQIQGIVELWGKIFVHEYGYRAEYGHLRALINAPPEVCEKYQVPNLPSVEYARKEYFE
jgi:hypothetical protein